MLFLSQDIKWIKMSDNKSKLDINVKDELEVSKSFLASDDHINFSKKIKLEKKDEEQNYFVALGIVESQHKFLENKNEIADTFEESSLGYVKICFFFQFQVD